MKIIAYDGSFTGLLTVIFHCYKYKVIPDVVYKKDSVTLLDIHKFIKTNQNDSKLAIKLISKKVGMSVFKNIFLAYLSEIENIEKTIIKYFFLSLKLNKNAEFCINKDYIVKIQKAIYKVKKEAHKFMGLLRFRKVSNNLYYAPFEPDHNIIILLTNHFAHRFSSQNWIIHDLKRSLALVYNKNTKSISLKSFSKIQHLKKEELPDDELYFQKLWKEYFNSVNIEERYNLKLQLQYMPLRYWKYLTEI